MKINIFCISILLIALFNKCHASSWECVSKIKIMGINKCDTWKMKVPDGWIVSSDPQGSGTINFVPDKEHKWND